MTTTTYINSPLLLSLITHFRRHATKPLDVETVSPDWSVVFKVNHKYITQNAEFQKEGRGGDSAEVKKKKHYFIHSFFFTYTSFSFSSITPTFAQ